MNPFARNNLPSASSLERAHLCPPSQVYRHFPSTGSPWSRRGTAIHRFLARVAEVGRELALEEQDLEFREACACIELDSLPVVDPSSYAFEVSFAYDLLKDTARELCRNKEREDAYALAVPGEQVGTADVIGTTSDAVLVYDYKTGYRWFDRLEENFQLMFYALAAARAYGRERAILGVIRINQEGHPYFILAEVGPIELDMFAARLRELDAEIDGLKHKHAAGEELTPVWGDHCQFCPALPNCPAHMTLARSMTSMDSNAPGLPELTAETAALYVEAVKRMKKVTARVERTVKLFAEQSPIDMGGGWVYGPHPFPVDVWDVGKAWPVLQHLLGEDAGKAVDAAVVKTRIEDIFRERKKADKKVIISRGLKEVLEALEKHDALTIRFTQPVGEHKPEEAALVEGQKKTG